MPFIRALYYPRLDEKSRETPPPRIVRLEVKIERHTWHAQVASLFPSTDIQSFTIDGPSTGCLGSIETCGNCGVYEDICLCTGIPGQDTFLLDSEKINRQLDELADTSYMMSFAAIEPQDEIDADEPLLDRESPSDEPNENIWARELLFIKLSGGLPIDIGTAIPGCGDPTSILATDIDRLKKFFSSLVGDKALVKRRFRPKVEDAGRPVESSRRIRSSSVRQPALSFSSQKQTTQSISIPEDDISRGRVTYLRRTQSARIKASFSPRVSFDCVQKTTTTVVQVEVREEVSRQSSTQVPSPPHPPPTEICKLKRYSSAPILNTPQKSAFTRKHKIRPKIEEILRYAASRRSWLHCV
ncbi:hypothetical protein DFH27DRAFT_526056 [Peziza echinospora]|nr:hypothetical protein DFH27DRAFT_526056 [Peziza echinospora]